jgi:hypothetical protein
MPRGGTAVAWVIFGSEALPLLALLCRCR